MPATVISRATKPGYRPWLGAREWEDHELPCAIPENNGRPTIADAAVLVLVY
jgi:hypothetical protein